ncbi:class I SAM-dependent methyltransferase [Cohnella luojiensis]|uniref:Methyltransferase domain-containing protein n=1 Tax=Cohnella luojiensis TaxID=652876 RepID=A0A4Y8M5V1_9BACL|nr:class I SAM-dependent methyltransferase [Cohnella luojiensis]TFE30654.1 methyltransferase domain-containing protein [Cohnella luojiensis]
MGDWFTESFGEDYKIVYRHRNWENAKREIGAMMEWVNIPANSSVLDVGCGMGRHALALKALGYEVTGLDLSEVLLTEARSADPEYGVDWVRGDMRSLPFDCGTFDATVNWFTSFGYFVDDQDNLRVLQEMRRVLKPDGRYLIDYLNPSYLLRHLVPESDRVDEPTGLRITEIRTIEEDFVIKKIEVMPPRDDAGIQGPSRHYEERVRLIGLKKFQGLLMEAGLFLERVYGDYDGSEYDSESSKRLILLGRRTG